MARPFQDVLFLHAWRPDSISQGAKVGEESEKGHLSRLGHLLTFPSIIKARIRKEDLQVADLIANARVFNELSL